MQSWGFAPIEADSVAEAVKHFKTDLPRRVLLDIDLPDGSGLDVLREIKREHPEAIVIMITGNVQIDNTISAFAAALTISSASQSIWKSCVSRFAMRLKPGTCDAKSSKSERTSARI